MPGGVIPWSRRTVGALLLALVVWVGLVSVGPPAPSLAAPLDVEAISGILEAALSPTAEP